MPDEETIKRALTGLVGKPLWVIRMAADVPMFHFGERHATQTRRGEPAEVGDFALHLQCEWYFTKDGSDTLELHEPFPVVQTVEYEGEGCFTIIFDQEYALEVFANDNDDDEDEQWRFFEPGNLKSHLMYPLALS